MNNILNNISAGQNRKTTDKMSKYGYANENSCIKDVFKCKFDYFLKELEWKLTYHFI